MYLFYNFCTTLHVSNNHSVHHQEFMIYCILQLCTNRANVSNCSVLRLELVCQMSNFNTINFIDFGTLTYTKKTPWRWCKQHWNQSEYFTTLTLLLIYCVFVGLNNTLHATHGAYINTYGTCSAPRPSHCYASPSKNQAVPWSFHCAIDIVLLTFPALRPNIP